MCFNCSVPPIDYDCCHLSIVRRYPICFVVRKWQSVFSHLSSVDPNKATGFDSKSARILKSTAAPFAPTVKITFDLSLTQHWLPVEWKVTQVIPIPKSEHKSHPSSYTDLSHCCE